MPKAHKSNPWQIAKTPFSNYYHSHQHNHQNECDEFGESSSLWEQGNIDSSGNPGDFDNAGNADNADNCCGNSDSINSDLNNDVSIIINNTPAFVQITGSNWNSDLF